ncbi:MAG: homoserine O-acetyltransferase MetX [Kiritimatiellia bacterium]
MSKSASIGQTVGVVAPQTLQLILPPEGFKLEKGGVLPAIQIAYECCGMLAPDKSNVIYVCHALTGDAHVAGIRPGETKPSGWWEKLIGPGRGIDTNFYHVICANLLGGCKGTTGPSSINPATGKPYGSQFPKITVGDIVTVQRLFLQQLGIERLAAVTGGSFGGMQTLEWAIRYPHAVDRTMVIASAPSLNSQALAFDILGRQAIVQDPDWQDGDYYDSGRFPGRGLAQARKLGHITYLSQQMMEDKFGREKRPEWLLADDAFHAESHRTFRTYFQIESYLQHQGETFIGRFDANSYLHITHAMDEYDLAERFGSLEQAFQGVQARMLIVALSGDWLFTAEQSADMVKALLNERKRVTYCHLEAPAGHDAFLTHIQELQAVIHAFLPWIGMRPAVPERPERLERSRAEYEAILDLVPPKCRVLDLGCGDGALLARLEEGRQTQGAGMEIAFDCVIRATDSGHDVLLEDIDDGLAIVPDNAFDIAVLSETLQVMRRPRFVLQQILRVAREAIITFPNFGYAPVRAQLLFSGRMPKGDPLPFEWYDTPNIHLFTLNDFLDLCRVDNIVVKDIRPLPGGPCSRLLLALGARNLAAERVIVRIARGEGKVIGQ